MAFNTGAEVPRRAVDAIIGPRTIQHETAVSKASDGVAAPMSKTTSSSGADSCSNHSKAFQDKELRVSWDVDLYDELLKIGGREERLIDEALSNEVKIDVCSTSNKKAAIYLLAASTLNVEPTRYSRLIWYSRSLFGH